MTDERLPTSIRDLAPVTDQAGLHRTWCTLMGTLGFSRRQLWVLLLEPDGRVLMGTHVDELPEHPDAVPLDNLTGGLASLGDGLGFAFLHARPGREPRTALDHAWLRALAASCRTAGLHTWPMHLATDEAITVVAPDDLADAG